MRKWFEHHSVPLIFNFASTKRLSKIPTHRITFLSFYTQPIWSGLNFKSINTHTHIIFSLQWRFTYVYDCFQNKINKWITWARSKIQHNHWNKLRLRRRMLAAKTNTRLLWACWVIVKCPSSFCPTRDDRSYINWSRARKRLLGYVAGAPLSRIAGTSDELPTGTARV